MDEYLGFREVTLAPDEISALFSDENGLSRDLLLNEYMIAKDEDGNTLELLKRKGDKLVKVPYKAISSRFLDKIKPRNIQQQMAIDMLYDPDTTIKVLTGPFGAGKDVLMASAAVDLIEHGKFDKIVYVRNNIEVKNSKPIGFLPGSYTDKLMPFAMPLADHLGGVDGLNLMMTQGRVEVVHLGFIRGRDIRNSIIICSEAENMTKEHMQLLISRVSEGSSLWINGDFKQRDAEVFARNSGLMAAIYKLRGHPRFAYVKLMKTERGETAAMADLLD